MTATLVQGPLHDRHLALGARMAPFAGWQMPIRYDGQIAEHHATRQRCGLFDVSHMGLLEVAGPGARTTLQALLGNDIDRLDADDRAQYTLLLNDSGGIEDDLIAYRLGAGRYWLVVNASRVAHDAEWIRARMAPGTELHDRSADTAIIAVQGPQAPGVLADLGLDIGGVPPFRHGTGAVVGAGLHWATTGYTGERGAELLIPVADAPAVWDALTAHGATTPCGLGARDTLRLEACYPLHGSDIDPSTSAVGAGLGWTLGWGTGFAGEEALAAERAAGPARHLAPLRVVERGIPRAGCPVLGPDGTSIGQVSSGTMSPTLGGGIALAWIDARFGPGSEVGIDIRGRIVATEVAERPLYRHD